MTDPDSVGVSAGRPRRVTDEEVFQALAEAITELGPTRWTLNDIGARVGLTGPALGYRFGNKRGLLVAFAAHQPHATAAHFDEAAADAASPIEAIYEALAGNLRHMDTRAKAANNIAMLSMDLADDELAEHAAAQARIIKAKVSELLNQAGLAHVRDVQALADMVYVVWSGALLAWAIDGDGPLDGWVRNHLDRVLSLPAARGNRRTPAIARSAGSAARVTHDRPLG